MPSLGSGASGFWTLLFVWSKIIELIDTLLLLLHGKELRFLHVYHHSSVLGKANFLFRISPIDGYHVKVQSPRNYGFDGFI